MGTSLRFIVRTILLAIVVIGISGVARTADAFLSAAPAACCADEAPTPGKGPVPCPAADCACAWCAGAETNHHPALAAVPGTAVRFAIITRSPRFPEFFASIDYPPEYR